MDKRNRLAILGIALVFVILALIIGISYLRWAKGRQASNDASSVPTSSQVSAPSSSAVEETPKSEFKEILFDTEPTMYGRSDYFSIDRMKMLKEMQLDYLQLEPLVDEVGLPVRYYLGHQIYQSQANGGQYILSGETVLPISGEGDNDAYGFIREEETGRLYHMFGNEHDLQNFLDSWDAGQKILNGEADARENAIILDGRLTDYHYDIEQGQICFDLSKVAPLISNATVYDSTMGYIDVYVNDCTFVRVPTTMANPMMQENLEISGARFRFKSWNGEDFECWGPVLDASEPLITAKDASMMFGWRFYTDGQTLSIVTDPLNVTDLAAIRENGDLGLRIVLEADDRGEKVIRAYDSQGNTVWEKPFEETLAITDEASESESASESIAAESALQAEKGNDSI